MTQQHQTELTLSELLMELIQGVQKMFAGSPGQDFPGQSFLVVFSESTPYGFHYTGGQSRNIAKQIQGGRRIH